VSKYLFVLAFFMIIVGIPVILGVGGDMFKRWLKHKEKMAEALNHETAERAAQYAARTERLEQRVRVLERIVTDKGLAVSDEIERLRDRPAPPALN
jgi:ABC-type Fe3+-hydroxamate transport system substrate-binding protein